MLLHLLLACKEPDGIKLDDSAVEESEVVDDSGGTDDSGDSVDSEDSELVGTPATFLLDGEWGGTTVSGTRFYFDSNDSILIGDGLFTAEATSATVEVGLPDLTDLEPLPDAPGVSYGVVMVSLHLDEDGDGYPSDERITGLGTFWMLYLEGDEAVMESLFLQPGWNVFRTDLPEGGSYPLDGIELSTNLLENESISAAGGYTGEGTPDGLGLAVFPQSQSFSFLLYDEPMSDPWSVTLEGTPPSDHFVDTGDGTLIALEFLLVYGDTDNSNNISEGDVPLYVTCNDAGDTISLVYLPEVRDLLIGSSFVSQGLSPGWVGASNPVDGSATEIITNEADLLTLSTCPANF